MHRNTLHPHARAEVRWSVLVAVYKCRFEGASEQVLAAEVNADGHALRRNGLQRTLQYLADSGLVTLEMPPGLPWRATVTVAGVDVVEHAVDPPQGVARPEVPVSMAVRQLREKRWHMLNALYVAAPESTTEKTLLMAINDVGSEISESVLRCELQYLEQLGLVALATETPTWRATLTPVATDLVEYATADEHVPPGVDRTEKYW